MMFSALVLLLKGCAILTLRLGGNMGSFPRPLRPEEEKTYIDLWAGGDLDARNKLIEHNLRLVAHIIKKYYTQNSDQGDLISIGTIGLIKGISTYKPEKGVKLATYASRCVENSTLTLRKHSVTLATSGRSETWRLVCSINEHFKIMVCRKTSGSLLYAPLYIHTISPLRPKTPDTKTFTTVGSKLQHYRREKLLFQQDLATRLGIDRSTYIRYETGKSAYYPPETLQKISEILEIDVTCLLDDYNLFLHRGQACQIKALRDSMGLSTKAFARLHGIYPSTVRSWECENTKISKKLWEKLFQ